MNKPREVFNLTEDHIQLLRHAYVVWEDCEAGAPAIDCKRPYGTSDMPGYVAELLGWTQVGPVDGEMAYTDEQCERAWQLHRETVTALQLLLLGFTEPGQYEHYDYRHEAWRPVEEAPDAD